MAKICKINDCNKMQRTKKYEFCSAHEWHYRKYGDPLGGQIETHGLSKHPLYSVWVNMRNRCHLRTHKQYPDYGARGIKVCNEWRNSFSTFYNDMITGYETGLWLDRTNNNQGYSKENCRWITPRIQQENRRNTRLFEFNGKKQTLTRWSEELGIQRGTLAQRYYGYKWSIDKVLTKGV